MNRHNQDEGMQPTSSVKQIRSTALLNLVFRQLLNRKRMIVQPQLNPQHWESLYRVLISSPEYRKCHKGHLDQ